MEFNVNDINLYEFEVCLDLFSLFTAKSFKVYSADGREFCGIINAKKTNETLPFIEASTSFLKRPAQSKPVKGPSPVKTSRKPVPTVNVAIPPKPGLPVLPTNQIQHFKEFTSEGERLYLCDLCSYRSNDRSNMKKHVNFKHNENCPKFQCSMCTLQVKAKQQLKGHYMKVHSLPENVAKSATADSAQA